jgi:hypothetical protein
MNADAASYSWRSLTLTSSASRPRLAPHVCLRFERARNRLFLVKRGQWLELDETATDVVRLCTGRNSVTAIIGVLTEKQGVGQSAGVALEVIGCLNALAAAALVLWCA